MSCPSMPPLESTRRLALPTVVQFTTTRRKKANRSWTLVGHSQTRCPDSISSIVMQVPVLEQIYHCCRHISNTSAQTISLGKIANQPGLCRSPFDHLWTTSGQVNHLLPHRLASIDCIPVIICQCQSPLLAFRETLTPCPLCDTTCRPSRA